MREATDLAISAGIRRELSGRRIDLSKIKFPVKAGVVSLQGELCFVGLEKSTDETAVELKFIESSLKKLPGVKELIFEFTNWNKNDSGIWEPSGNQPTSPGAAARGVIDGEGLVCPDCEYVIRFCPCCGKPLAGAGSKAHAAGRFRKPVPPVKPIIKKKRPVSPLLSPVVKPTIPDTPVISSPEIIKNIPAGIPGAKIATAPAGKPEVKPPFIKTAEPALPPTKVAPAPVKPAPIMPAAPSVTHTPPAAPVRPATPAPVSPAKPAIAPAQKPASPAPTIAKPIVPTPAMPLKAEPSQKPVTAQPAETTKAGFTPPTPEPENLQPKDSIDTTLPGEFDTDVPDFSNFSLKNDEESADAAGSSTLDSLFGSLKSGLPDSDTPDGPAFPAPKPVSPAAHAKPAKPAGSIPDFNFDDLLSSGKEDDKLPQSSGAAFEPPAFDLGSLGDLDSSSVDTETPGSGPGGFEPPADNYDDTPLPPQKPAAAPARVIETFEDDDTPLPPMKPQTPPTAKGGKDLFASLFSDTDVNLGLPADNSGQNKNPFGNLDLELDILEVFPGNEEPAPAAAPAQGKKPPAPAQPAPADDNPFNLDNIIDLDSPVEEKSPSKKKGSNDPFNLDDFDISKFKL